MYLFILNYLIIYFEVKIPFDVIDNAISFSISYNVLSLTMTNI